MESRSAPAFLAKLPANEDKNNYIFMQYMESTLPFDNIGHRLNCACLTWSSDDEVEHTLK